MVHIILLILRGAGIFLLVLLLLILAALAAVLFVPVRYRVKASVLEKKPDVSVRVTWLLHLLSVSAEYHPEEGPFALRVRILGFEPGKKAGGKRKEKKEKKEERLEAEEESSVSEAAGQEPQEFRMPEDKIPEEKRFNEPEPEPEKEEEDGARGERELRKRQKICRPSRPSLLERLGSLVRLIRDFFERLRRGAVSLGEKKEKLTAFLEDETNRKTLGLLRRQAGAAFRHIRPRKLRLYLRFGFEDPYWTGKVLGYASVFYAYYYKNIELVPEFEQEALEGELYARGRIRAAAMLALGGRMLLDRGFRNMVKKGLRRT